MARGSIFALLGSNGAGKTTIVRILTTLLKPDDGTTQRQRIRRPVAAGAGAGVDQPDRSIRGRGRDPHRPREPDHDRRTTAREGRGQGGRRSARAVRPRRRGRAPGVDLLGRHAPSPRHRHEPHRQPADHLPRRADQRPRPGGPHRGVAGDPEPRRQRHDRVPDDPVPRRGREARRPDRDPARRHDHRVRHAGGPAGSWSRPRRSNTWNGSPPWRRSSWRSSAATRRINDEHTSSSATRA